MSKMIATSIRRTGRAETPVRHLVVVQGSGKEAVERILSAAIEKVQWGVEFRHGGKPAPMEQYAFRVGGKTVSRFADAAALVLKKHHVEVEAGDHQEYLKAALAIMKGEEGLREVVLPETATPAIGQISTPKAVEVQTAQA